MAAPTGSGKTVVGEFAAWLALRGGGKAFYTTPIKALSNQKFGDLSSVHGPGNVGLLTGDNSINGRAPVVVMTTEVLRNMIYEDSDALHGLRYVVLDEVHYLQDRYRGGVWEEILIHLPVDVQIVSLSATVSNAEEFAEWLQTLRGRTEVIIEETRPVELRHWYFAADELLPMFVSRRGQVMPNPRGREFDRRKRHKGPRPQRGDRRTHRKRARIPWRSEVVERLEDERMLPAIYFIFSRKGCAEATRQCLRAGLRLTTSDERARILAYADERVADLSPGELDILGYGDWIAGLESGFAAHHAGMIPPFKEVVEELFAAGLVKVVFATETLALGINMPARTVVIESLTKFTGEKHELMTPGEFTQLCGRAGRRGMDELGHAVVLMQRYTPFDGVTRLASTRTHPLRSSFQPSYNMAVNLVRNYDLEEAEHLVNSSFAQFQADRSVVRIEKDREQAEAYLASYRERLNCEKGDFAEYLNMTRALQRRQKETSAEQRSRSRVVADELAGLETGDVIEISTGKRRGRYAVVEVVQRRSQRRPRVLMLARNGSLVRLDASDLRDPPDKLGRLPLPLRHRISDPEQRSQVAEKIRSFPKDAGGPEEPAEDPEMAALRHAIESHPVHSCPELGRHIHFSERAARLEKDIAGYERRIARSAGTLARRFEQVVSVLEGFGYVEGWKLSRKGELLARVYNEADLLVVEAIESGLFDDLRPPEVAALLSTLVYETRGPEPAATARMPTARCAAVWKDLMRLWRRIKAEEDGRRLDLTREPDPGFAEQAFLWAQGTPLGDVIDEEDAPGDFVRVVKQLIDLLRQLSGIVPAELGAAIDTSVDGLDRGIVAYSSIEVG